MKSFRFVIVALLSSSSFAGDQLVMVENHECNAMNAINSAVERCGRNDLEGFLECFTKSNRVRVRKNVKKLFSGNNFNVKILSSEITSADEKFARATVRYRLSVDGYSPVTVDSSLVLKLEGDSWLIQSERVSSARTSDYAAQRELEFNFGGGGIVMIPEINDDEGPADIGRHELGRCVKCRKPEPGIRHIPDFLNPDLPAGIGQHPEAVCKDGVCIVK